MVHGQVQIAPSSSHCPRISTPASHISFEIIKNTVHLLLNISCIMKLMSTLVTALVASASMVSASPMLTVVLTDASPGRPPVCRISIPVD